jgi:hypothetical protein
LVKTYVSKSPDGVNRSTMPGSAAADRRTLTDYIAKLEAIPISKYDRREQFAYWVNLYNALTLEVVLGHYPVESILDVDISPGLFADGPWDKKLIEVEGQAISLNGIEHRILRLIWRGPRIHYAVNCASIGCLNLQAKAFTSDNADKLMDNAARAYVNHPRGSQVVDEELTPPAPISGIRRISAAATQALSGTCASTLGPTSVRRWPRSMRSLTITTTGRSTPPFVR